MSPVSPEVMIYVEGMPPSYRGPSLVSRALLSSVALQTPQVSSVLEEEAGADSRFPDFVLLRPASSSGISWSGPAESTSSVPRTHRTLIPGTLDNCHVCESQRMYLGFHILHHPRAKGAEASESFL